MAPTIAAKDIPTLTQLYVDGVLKPTSSPTKSPNASYNDKICLVRTDITKLAVDSIVNAANESLLGGGGVDGAIHRAAGPKLLEECETLDGCDTGDAKITDAYELPAKKVIHAVGPVYFTTKRQGKHTQLLQGCYRKSLELAVQNNLKSIAFSALSTGVYGYPSNEAAEAAIEQVRTFLDGGKGDKLEKIVFCNFMEKDEKAYQEKLPIFFPPPESSSSGECAEPSASSEPSKLAEQLPDAPTTEPSQEGQPEAKKVKVSHDSSVEATPAPEADPAKTEANKQNL